MAQYIKLDRSQKPANQTALLVQDTLDFVNEALRVQGLLDAITNFGANPENLEEYGFPSLAVGDHSLAIQAYNTIHDVVTANALLIQNNLQLLNFLNNS